MLNLLKLIALFLSLFPRGAQSFKLVSAETKRIRFNLIEQNNVKSYHL